LERIYAKEILNSGNTKTLQVFFEVCYKMQHIKGITCCFPNNPHREKQLYGGLPVFEEREEGEEVKEGDEPEIDETKLNMLPAVDLIERFF
jgi:hypothetical protein